MITIRARALFALLLLSFGLAGVPGFAQEPPAPTAVTEARPGPAEMQAKLESLKVEIDQIASGLQREGQTDRQLVETRTRVDGIRSDVERIAQAESPRLAAVEARLKQLGPAPVAKDDEPAPVEADAIKTEREDQQKQLAAVQGLVKQAQFLSLRTDEIAASIGDMRRSRFTRDLVERSRSVLDPSLWLEAAQSLPAVVSGLGYLLRDWFGLLASRGFETAIAVGSVILALVAVLFGARRRLAQATERDPDAIDPPMLKRSLKAAGIVFVNFAVPVLGLVGITKALDAFDLNPARVEHFLAALIAGFASAAAIYGVALAILAPGKPQWRMAAVGDQSAARLLRRFVALAAVNGVGVWAVRLLDVLSASVTALILASAVFAVADAVLVMLALRAAARSLAGDEETSEIAAEATEERSSLWRWIVPLGWIVTIAALVAAAMGYVALAAFITRQTILTGVLLGALYIVLVLADEVVLATFHARSPFGVLMTRSMGLARETVEQIGVVLSGVLRLFIIVSAGLLALAPIGVDGQDIVADAKVAFFGFKVGGLTFSLSAILSGVVFLAVGMAVTRGIQGWLDQRFLPRTRLDVGLKNSIRTAFGYVGTIVSVALAFSVVGLDLQNFAIVAGALSVGVGFGLQSIVNNFVSGLILLAERPIKAGDLVEIGSEKGFVRKINVRSTEIETFDRASLIVPNSSLISGNVKNWMHRDLTGRCVVDVGVAYDADPSEVRSILIGVAEAHDKVLRVPAPGAFFTNFGSDALEFRLICTVGAITDAYGVESDLRFAIVAKLREKGIEIPYAQRDVNIRQLGDLSELLDRIGLRPASPKATDEGPAAS